MKIFVGNMPFSMTVEELQNLFDGFGVVENASLAVDRETGRLRGFAFLEMPDEIQAQKAISSLNGTMQSGRRLVVGPAKKRES